MIRILLGSALPIFGLGVAAAVLGPDLVTGPRGEPLIMAAPGEARLQAASFDDDACATKVPFADSSNAAAAGTRIIAFALRSGADDVAVAVEDFPNGAATARETVVLIFDETGRLIAAGNPASLDMRQAAAPSTDCVETPEPSAPPV